MRFRSLWKGVVMLIIGLVLLFKVLGIISISLISLWPLLLLGFGLSYENVGWSDPRTNSASLVTGGVLITYGLMFLGCELLGWRLMQYIWPCFLLGPAVGLYQHYLVSRSRGQLVEARMLAGIAIVLMLGAVVPMRYMVPGLMIGAGIMLMISILRRSR